MRAKRIVIISLCTIIIVGGTLLVLMYEPHPRDTVEFARRIVCKSQQKRIYLAAVEYNKKYGKLPADLRSLAENGNINERGLYCPATHVVLGTRRYKYFPENFLNSNSPLISESLGNHSGKELKLKKLRPVIIETMGDGKCVITNIELSQ